MASACASPTGAIQSASLGVAAQQYAIAGPCGRPVPPSPIPIRHIVLVMLENHSYRQVVGNAAAPYQTGLAADCGSASAMFAATHTSAANYLAVAAGEFPASSPKGCGSVAACADRSDNLYRQLDSVGLSWRAYEESMPAACSGATDGGYKIGHNPPIFYRDISDTECRSYDLSEASLAAESGPLWSALQTQTLPAVSWVTPNKAHDGEGSSNRATALAEADAWLAAFLPLVVASASYQAGSTLVLITYDEGFGGDARTGEDCTNKARDLPVVNGISAHQDSCHVPLFVVYPYTPAGVADGTFFDDYSLTRTVEDLFQLPHLAHAGDVQTTSLIGHFGIA